MVKVVTLPDEEEQNRPYLFAKHIIEKYSDTFDFVLVGRFSDNSAQLVIREKSGQEEKANDGQSG